MAKGIGGSMGRGMSSGMKGGGFSKRGPGHTKPLFSKPAGSGGGAKQPAPVKEPRPGGMKDAAPQKQVGMQGGMKDEQQVQYQQDQGQTRRVSCIGCALPALAAGAVLATALLSAL